jgi:AcrR family transcriptional regulator
VSQGTAPAKRVSTKPPLAKEASLPKDKKLAKKAAKVEDKPAVMGRPRSEDARRRILAAARELLEERGLRSMTICGIAERAATSKVTVYRWWSHKAAIVLEAMLSETSPIMPYRESSSPLESLRAQMKSFARFLLGPNGRLLIDVIAEGVLDAEIGNAYRKHWVKPRREDASRLLQSAIEAGELAPDADIEVILDALFGPLYYRFLIKHAPLTPAFAEQVFEGVMAGVAMPAARKRLGLG